jgi:predicted KAP-like P-loop ATPase
MIDFSTEGRTEPPRLSGDKPIRFESEDVLGFTTFADALARSLTEMAPDDGLAISVEGEWGAGKTSAIELTRRRVILRELSCETGTKVTELERQDPAELEQKWNEVAQTRRTHIVPFNPWNFSGQENLTRAFFKEVGAVIGHPPDGPVAKAVKKITDYLPSAGAAIGSGIGAAAGHVSGIGPGATVGRAVGESAQRLFGGTDSLETAKRELGDALREAGKKIIVIIDDLDRLAGR